MQTFYSKKPGYYKYLKTVLASFILLIAVSANSQTNYLYYLTSDNAAATATDALRRVKTDATGDQQVATGFVNAPGTVAIDVANNRAFIADVRVNNPKIYAVNLTTNVATTFFTPSANTLAGITVDNTNKYLYYLTSDGSAATTTDELRRIKLDGTGDEQVAIGFAYTPGTVAIDVANSRAFVSDIRVNFPKIYAIDLTTKAASTFFIATANTLAGITMDNTNKFLYYLTNDGLAANTADELRRIKPDGTGDEQVATGFAFAPGTVTIDVTNNRAFVSEVRVNFPRIYAVNLSTKAAAIFISLTSTSMGGIAIAEPAIVQSSNSTDYFRTAASGNWNSVSTWESSTDNVTYHAASLTPDFNANLITVRAAHTVTVTAGVTIDQATVNLGGAIVINSGNALSITDGIGADITVNGSVTVNSGGNMIIKSIQTGTASIGNSSGAITGNVTVERFIPARRAWRLMNAPLITSSSQTVNAAWQEGGANTAGLGTLITGGTTAAGFDQSLTNNSSIKVYDQANNIFNPLGTTLNPLSAQPGYFLFVRGDRNVDITKGASAPATNTTLRATGTLKTGNQSVPVAASGFTLVGNPFASPIDFSAVTKTNVPDRFYVWDPKRATIGAYVLFEGPGYMPITTGGSYTGSNSLIQSSQAFLVEGNSNGTAGNLSISESSKSVVQNNVFRTNDGADEKLQVNLNFNNADSTTTLADAALARYNNLYSLAVTAEDAGKPDNVDENIAIIRDGHKLMVERRHLIDNADTIFLEIYNMKLKSYEFEITPAHFSAPALVAYLEDAYLHTSTAVSLDATSKISFSITTDAASADPHRFRIVFKTSGILPISFVSVNAYCENAGIQVAWDVATENNIKQYEVEKSADGQNFTKTGSATARGNNNAAASYNWFDATPFSGNNFYRIKAASKSGEINYSMVVKVRNDDGKVTIAVYPNPVENNTINLQLNNEPKGKYTVQLFNGLGQKMMTKLIEHTGGSATQTIKLSSVVNKGIYQLHVSNGDNKTIMQMIVP